MTEPEYSDDYTDPRLAAFYDQLNPWGPDRDFYLGLVMSAESVLDVGCGTGTLLRQARASGHAGRTVAERYGSWDRRPFSGQMPEIITVATRA